MTATAFRMTVRKYRGATKGASGFWAVEGADCIASEVVNIPDGLGGLTKPAVVELCGRIGADVRFTDVRFVWMNRAIEVAGVDNAEPLARIEFYPDR